MTLHRLGHHALASHHQTQKVRPPLLHRRSVCKPPSVRDRHVDRPERHRLSSKLLNATGGQPSRGARWRGQGYSRPTLMSEYKREPWRLIVSSLANCRINVSVLNWARRCRPPGCLVQLLCAVRYGTVQKGPISFLVNRATLTSLTAGISRTLAAVGQRHVAVDRPLIPWRLRPVTHSELRLDATLACGQWTRVEMASCGGLGARRHILARPTSTGPEHRQNIVEAIFLRAWGFLRGVLREKATISRAGQSSPTIPQFACRSRTPCDAGTSLVIDTQVVRERRSTTSV